MKKIAIVGTGPTGIYTFFSLLKQGEPLNISLYEQSTKAGVGMPYSNEENSKVMLANIASIEIPPLCSTYIDWLKQQSEAHLARYGVALASLHVRQFLPRILLGEFFRDQFMSLVKQAKQQGFAVTVHESCQVTDLKAEGDGVRLWSEGNEMESVDYVVVATGHVWPDEKESTKNYFPSPWSGLMEANIEACNVGILGTSLSGLDAAMAVAIQHGRFIEEDDGSLRFTLNKGSEGLKIALMSRTGVLPEADFYCPLPYEPLSIATEQAIHAEINAGSDGLLDRVFALLVEEVRQADPAWYQEMALDKLNVDTFAEAWFAERKKRDPFHWAEENLKEVERNKRDKRTVAWRYAILRMHEVIEDIVPALNDDDRERFRAGLARVFIDNYAAIPSQSIRRLLALREAGIIDILTLGQDYQRVVRENKTIITTQTSSHEFDVFIDARGQKPLRIKDLPFPALREQLLSCGESLPDVGEDYTLQQPDIVRGRIAFGALPWLMHDRPFVQGLTVCAEIAEAMAKAIARPASRTRRKLPFYRE
ncbi:FAD/NAD(P) binding domain-containing protein [Citrobacter amalonaticus]|uniref:FAD/NAD(P) binding domain-containing protein n=1 Tax=Citrobacter amalonaticus TaxID=35703 RepID=A0A2S4RYZ8_CITAM|nr:FAD-NAD(P)-binding protein [Citrobacter amalonaticus]POT57532.1 FAD/NAD(P) binding domain-containing protein [Citrobacter amalonaticus]POT76941.1 FAD/NAD(P) binding domain-containing protein [Citrobacter amalonaticus]POU66019.1 FAD/NAD(P) binding domain-containing protein [Citrobacter amalonaticus]POV06176.1 FAD/NAD(P) binding domain-containing protein [Citrobacter amalonaticus]